MLHLGLSWPKMENNKSKYTKRYANEGINTEYQNLCGTVKAVQKGKSIAISPYVKKTSKGADKGDNHTSKGAQNTTAK